MINFDPIHVLSEKIKSLSVVISVAGVIFILLGIGIIFVPQIIQYIFVIGFVLLGLFSFAAALWLSHIRDAVTRFEIFPGKKK